MFIQERRESDLSFTVKRRKRPSRRDRCMDLNRSVSLVLVISQFLGFSALLILAMSGYDNLIQLLRITEQELAYLHGLPYAIQTANILTLLMINVLCMIGIYGFAVLNRYPLAVYMTNALIFAVFLISFCLEPPYNESIPRTALFKNFQEKKVGWENIDVIQKHDKCCGTSFYRFEDLDSLPGSCCGLERNDTCLIEDAYTSVCSTKRANIWTSYHVRGLVGYITLAAFTGIGILIFEALLTAHMIYRLGKRQLDAAESQLSTVSFKS